MRVMTRANMRRTRKGRMADAGDLVVDLASESAYPAAEVAEAMAVAAAAGKVMISDKKCTN